MGESESKWNLRDAGRRFVEGLNSPLGFALSVVGLAVAYFAIVDWRVQRIVEDPDFIEKVAQRVRPAMVFDSDGRILQDSGAFQLLDGPPEVAVNDDPKSFLRATIVIKPKFVISEPILESLDFGNVSVKTQRGRGTAWEMTVYSRYRAITTSGAPEVVELPRYRLEISLR